MRALMGCNLTAGSIVTVRASRSLIRRSGTMFERGHWFHSKADEAATTSHYCADTDSCRRKGGNDLRDQVYPLRSTSGVATRP
jgi:hypothetical protein